MNRLMKSRNQRGQLKVLVAHSSPSFGRTCAELVSSGRGARLAAITTSASETLREAGRVRPDVIFLGTRLRGANGLNLLLACKRQLPAACVIMVAERSGAPAMMKYLAAGADLFIGRPDAMHQVPKILRHLARRRVHRRVAGDLGHRVPGRRTAGME